jgi:hypothetical protein
MGFSIRQQSNIAVRQAPQGAGFTPPYAEVINILPSSVSQVVIQNTGSNRIYFGTAYVSGTDYGWYLDPGQTIQLTKTDSVYAIATAGASQVNIFYLT